MAAIIHRCPVCGCPCTIGGEHTTHFYIPHPEFITQGAHTNISFAPGLRDAKLTEGCLVAARMLNGELITRLAKADKTIEKLKAALAQKWIEGRQANG